MMQPPLYKAVYEKKDTYGFFEQDDLNWQAQWYSATSLNEDKYERGGWYRTEKEALEAAERGKRNSDTLMKLVESGTTDISREELQALLRPEPMTGKEIVESGLLDEITDESLPDGGEWRDEQRKKRQQRRKKW